ncbi:MAG: sigma-54-dependent Fis family transcriptional regulator [marine bacterium B5-7]|nr:MAG: sigma-54-dependent Fis family transcriptional regulator [marine bacterium B5-7]
MNKPSILIVDDEPDICNIIGDILDDEGYETTSAENADNADKLFKERDFDLVLLDIWMPGTDGITLLKQWMSEGCNASIIMISGHGTVETAVEAIRIGAYDFLEKPLSTAKLLVTVERALANRELLLENRRLRTRLEPASELVGSSGIMQTLRQKIARYAATDGWVLIQGEAGSGKGVTARSLHRQSPRAKGSFVEINLAALPSENIPLQLFGRDDDEIVAGSLERADGGTLVLDEVADLDASLQAKLLSALEERSFYRVGGREKVTIDVRVIATTNQDLTAKIEVGQFRRDLYDRLNQLPLFVPPLREHREDVPELVDAVVRIAMDAEGFPYRRFSTSALNVLRNHRWPGNVRELQNLIHRVLLTSEHEEISSNDITSELDGRGANDTSSTPTSAFNTDLREAREAFERAYLLYHLEQAGGNMTELANRTGLERTHLYRKLKGLGIDTKGARRAS